MRSIQDRRTYQKSACDFHAKRVTFAPYVTANFLKIVVAYRVLNQHL
jgi:hypothetical protein